MSKHTYAAKHGTYELESFKANWKLTYWKVKWIASVGTAYISSIGTIVEEGHGMPYFSQAKTGMMIHSRSMGDPSPFAVE